MTYQRVSDGQRIYSAPMGMGGILGGASYRVKDDSLQYCAMKKWNPKSKRFNCSLWDAGLDPSQRGRTPAQLNATAVLNAKQEGDKDSYRNVLRRSKGLGYTRDEIRDIYYSGKNMLTPPKKVKNGGLKRVGPNQWAFKNSAGDYVMAMGPSEASEIAKVRSRMSRYVPHPRVKKNRGQIPASPPIFFANDEHKGAGYY